MPRGGPNYTELTHRVVREAPEPLSLDAIVAQVVERAGAATKNPKNTVRSALAQSLAIVRLPDGRYGWKSRLINGAIHRVALSEEDLDEALLFVGEATRDLLLPTRHDDKYGPKGPPAFELEAGPTLIAPVHGELSGRYQVELGAPFWEWLEERGAKPGDSLLLTAVDGDARRYHLRHEPRAARDEATILSRNGELIDTAVGLVQATRGRSPIWEIVGLLNARGLFHHPTPPDPFELLWTEEVWGPLADDLDASPLLIGGFDAEDDFFLPDEDDDGPLAVPIDPADIPPGMSLEQVEARLDALLKSPTPPRLAADDPLLPILAKVMAAAGMPSPTGRPYTASQLVEWFGADPETLAWIADGIEYGMVEPDADLPAGAPGVIFAGFANEDDDPADLPAAYGRTGRQRRPQPSAQGSKGPVETYTLRVAYRFKPDFWRDIEIAADQNLEDLHLAIQAALGWGDDHLYSFYTGTRPYDKRTEIGSPWSEARRHTHQVALGSLKLSQGKRLLYHFDYGDDHLFDVEVIAVNPAAPKGRYPKVVGRRGRRLEQYPDDDEMFIDEGEE